MTEDRRVWLVVTGSYSDYQVECAAGSEADGEQIAATINAFGGPARRGYEDARVVSVPLVTPPVAGPHPTIRETLMSTRITSDTGER